VSVHIYQHAMETCNLFAQTRPGWYRREALQLVLDAA
jgi:hypothetical protein